MSGEQAPCIEEALVTLSVEDVEDYFELERCQQWCVENAYSRVALQFPDNLLAYSTTVSWTPVYLFSVTSSPWGQGLQFRTQ